MYAGAGQVIHNRVVGTNYVIYINGGLGIEVISA